MSRLPELHVIEHEEPPFRIRKLHGSWVLQHKVHHKLEENGEATVFEMWEFLSAHPSQSAAMAHLDVLWHYDPAHHHLEPCS